MANGSDGFIGVREVTHDVENARIQADVFGRAAARDDQRVVIFGLNFVQGSIQPKIMTALFAVRLVSFEIMDCGSHHITGSLIGTDSVNRMPDHEQRLEGDHDFIIFYLVTHEHEKFFRGHRVHPGIARR